MEMHEEIDLVRKLYDPKHTIDEYYIRLFIKVAKEKKLDYTMSQICLIPKMDRQNDIIKGTIITQIDGFRLIAERTGKYAPGKETLFQYNNSGNILSATAFVKKMTDDGTWHEIGETAFLSEYRGASRPWQQMPHVMLSKCAEARAIRRAFPGDLSGIYTKDEMDQAEEVLIEADSEMSGLQKETNTINQQELQELKAYLNTNGKHEKDVLEYFKIKKITELSKDDFERIVKKGKSSKE